MITVATFTKPEEAHLLRMRLESAGIHAFIQDEYMVQMDLLYSNAIGGVRVQVADEDEAAVRELLQADAGLPTEAEEPSEQVEPPANPTDNCSWVYPILKKLLFVLPFLLLLYAAPGLNFAVRNSRSIGEFFRYTFTSPSGIARALVESGIKKQKAGDLDGALADYTKSLQLKDDNFYAYYDRGQVRRAKGDLAGALKDYDNAFALKPDDFKNLLNRGAAKQAQGNLDGALDDYDLAILLKSDFWKTYADRGTVEYKQGDFDKALTDFNKAIELKTDESILYIDRARAKSAKSDLEGALSDLNEAIRVNPSDADAYDYSAYLKCTTRDFDGALMDVNKAIAIQPDHAAAYATRGSIKKAKSNFTGAMADYDKAIELAPKTAGNYYHDRGCLFYDLREFKRALADFQKACELGLKKSSNNAYPHFRVYLIRSQLEESRVATEELKAYMASAKAGNAEDWIVKIGLFLTDQLPEIDFLNAAKDSNEKTDKSRHCEAWFYAGTQRLIAGDKVTAKEYFKRCIATGQVGYFEYASAVAELKFLESMPPE